MISNFFLLLGILVAFLLSGMFSGVETGMYQLSRLRMRLGVEKKKFLYRILSKTMQDPPAILLTMLLSNNLANYFVTSFLTYFLLRILHNERSAEFFTTIIITPTLFIFSELIPKNLFFYRADLLMPYTAPILFFFHKIFTSCGIIWLIKSISHIVEHIIGWSKPSKELLTAAHQPHINAIYHESHEEGLLTITQADIIKRMGDFTQLTVNSVMTPVNRTQTIRQNCDRAALLAKLQRSPFTRLPVIDKQSNIIGFVNVYETLLSDQPFESLDDFIKPISKISSSITVSDAINIMKTQNLKIMLVTKTTYGLWPKPLGIITMKDLVEELIGEVAEW